MELEYWYNQFNEVVNTFVLIDYKV